MTDKPPTEDEIARQLTSFLFSSPGYNRDSVIMEMVKGRITQLAREVASEVVKASPDLRQRLWDQSETVLRQAMLQDSWFSKTVIDSVAKSLANAAIYAPPEDSNV